MLLCTQENVSNCCRLLQMQNVFSRVILSGRTVTEDLAVFHDNLYKIFFAILKVNGMSLM